MADQEIRFGPDDHIVFLLIRRTRSAECATLTGFERHLESDALCVFDDPSVAGCVAALLDEDYRCGGAGEDYPGGAATCAVLDLADSERVRAYEDLNDRREWKDELRQRAWKHADECRAVKSRMAEQASGKSEEGHPTEVARSPSGKVILYGPGYPPRVSGHLMKKLSNRRYDLIAALVEAGEDGLTKDCMESVVPSARRMLKKLRHDDKHWRSAIQMAEETGQGYRIL